MKWPLSVYLSRSMSSFRRKRGRARRFLSTPFEPPSREDDEAAGLRALIKKRVMNSGGGRKGYFYKKRDARGVVGSFVRSCVCV
mmetsp:Transcript_9835/g.32026  ORF Transcript_9835/g.32026 Transcript_9835/m.32026 type:complete len:84 (+) Transcript_9835:2807-3058(+)